MRKFRTLKITKMVGFWAIFCLFVAIVEISPAKAIAKTIRLKFVSFVPLSNKIEYQKFKKDFIDKVNEEAKGELVIDVRGGPEAIPAFNLAMAVQKGVIDLATIPTAFLESIVPGANQTCLSDYTAIEERENGVYDYIQKMYMKRGLYYLGRAEATNPGYFFLYLKKRAEKPSDFKGLILGGSTAFHGFYQKLGAGVATVAIPEYYSAMERGVVDGVVTSLPVGMQFGLQEVSKYIIVPGFYRSTVALPMNLNTWRKLPKHLQKLMIKLMVKFEKEYPSYEMEKRAELLKRMEKAGVKIIKLKGKAQKWYLNCAIEGAWKYAGKKFPGNVIPELRKIITKK